MVGRQIFLRYIQEFANYNVIYGSLAVVIVLILWVWIASVIMIMMGEIASHIHWMMILGLPAEEVRRRHLRRAPTRQDQEDEKQSTQP